MADIAKLIYKKNTMYSSGGGFSPETQGSTGQVLTKTATGYDWDDGSNTKVFELPTDLTTAEALAVAQEAYDWYDAGNYPVLYWESSSRYFYIGRTQATRIGFYKQPEFKDMSISGITNFTYDVITFNFSDGVVTSITNTTTTRSVVATGVDYSTPYTPQYDGSPATKKYVDDQVGDIATLLANI